MTGLLQHPAVQRLRPGGDLPQGLRPSARARRNKILARVLWTGVGILFVAFAIRGISDWFRPPIAPAVAAVPVAAGGGDSQRFAASFAYTLRLLTSISRSLPVNGLGFSEAGLFGPARSVGKWTPSLATTTRGLSRPRAMPASTAALS